MEKKWTIGVCAMDTKARSKPMRNILDRLLSFGKYEATIFGDNVILNEPITLWPECDFLISFFSDGFPLEKAIEYVKLRRPFCLNDLPLQQLLIDRRIVLELLDKAGIPTPVRLTTWHKDLPPMTNSVRQSAKKLGLDVDKYENTIIDAVLIDAETVKVGENILKKPFVEKPVSGEDHNIYIYYDQLSGGGVRKLFRKKGNKSSEFVPDLCELRSDGKSSFLYEEFISVDNAEDVKVYTIGPDYAHAETRKSPVVDGVVHRNAEGKEIRYVTDLSEEESQIARKVCGIFGQTICGFDLLRANGKSYVIDVNGWSFVKGNDAYYDMCSRTISDIFTKQIEKFSKARFKRQLTYTENQWRLKAFLSVMRHGDRTPKQKVKHVFQSDIFLRLVNGSEDELILKSFDKFSIIITAVEEALALGVENQKALTQILQIMEQKGKLSGTKIQLRPIFGGQPKVLKKMQLIIKWGGRFTHAGHEQSKDLGENLRKDLSILNRKVLEDLKVYSSAENRVQDTASVFTKAFLDVPELDSGLISVTREMLDDSNAAKELTDQTKVKLQAILNPDFHTKPPKVFLMPDNWPDFANPVQELIDLLRTLRDLMHVNLQTPKEHTVWCCYESPGLFAERWEKLFREFCDVERTKFEPSKVSELYDALKFDLLHNREYLFYVFHHPTENYTARLCQLSKEIFDIIGPHEYGIENDEKLEIGLKNVQHLLRSLISELRYAKESTTPFTRLYFTKESKVYSLLNVVLLCGIKTNYNPTNIAELDYLSQITFELYERITVGGEAELALRIGFSPGISQ